MTLFAVASFSQTKTENFMHRQDHLPMRLSSVTSLLVSSGIETPPVSCSPLRIDLLLRHKPMQ